MRTAHVRRLLVAAVALLTASAALPAAAAGPPTRQDRPAHGGLSAVVRYTEYGIPHILAEDYADLGFGTGWAQAADQVCTLADGFVTVRGDRSRFFGPAAAAAVPAATWSRPAPGAGPHSWGERNALLMHKAAEAVHALCNLLQRASVRPFGESFRET